MPTTARTTARLLQNFPRIARGFSLALVALSLAVGAAGCGYNEVIDRDEDVKASWAEVQNQYQRRSDLVPNLVKVVKGNAAFEKETLEGVVEARAKVAGVKVNQSVIDDPAKLKQFEQAQQGLTSALSRLMVVVERYPDLKATEGFRNLQAQLEGTENRVAVARKRYIETIAEYNKVVERFPTSLGSSLRHKAVRASFSVAPGVEKAPDVQL